MNKKKISFPVMFQRVNEFQTDDNRFTKVKIWLMHLGKNYNGSIFDKEYVDKAIETLEYIPIVGFIEKNSQSEEDFSDHRWVVIKDKNGTKQEYLGISYGVVKATDDNNAHYEDRLCDDGVTRTFLVVDGLLWNMFKGSEIMNRDLIKSHSMELDPESYDGFDDEDGIFHFTDFSFRAACILGEDYEPGMHSSTIEVQFAMSDFVRGLQTEIKNKLTDFSRIIAKQEGGENLPKVAKKTNTDFEQTVLQQFEDISAIVESHETYRNRWGDERQRYYVRDIQGDEVIITDTKDNYRVYGVSFSVDGDKPVVNFDSKKRKKFVYEDYEEGETPKDENFDFGKYIEDIEETAFNKVSEMKTKLAEKETEFESIKKDLDEIKPQLEDYVRQEKEQKQAEIAEQKQAIVSEYEMALTDSVDFQAIKEKIEEFTPEDLETKCAILYAKTTLPKQNFSKAEKQSGALELIETENKENAFISRYGIDIKKG